MFFKIRENKTQIQNSHKRRYSRIHRKAAVISTEPPSAVSTACSALPRCRAGAAPSLQPQSWGDRTGGTPVQIHQGLIKHLPATPAMRLKPKHPTKPRCRRCERSSMLSPGFPAAVAMTGHTARSRHSDFPTAACCGNVPLLLPPRPAVPGKPRACQPLQERHTRSLEGADEISSPLSNRTSL